MKFFCDLAISDFDFDMWQDMDSDEAYDDTGCFSITMIDDEFPVNDSSDECGVLLELQSYDSLYIEGIIGYFEDFGHIEYLEWYGEGSGNYADYMCGECEAEKVEDVSEYCDVYVIDGKRSLLKVTRPCFGKWNLNPDEFEVLV